MPKELGWDEKKIKTRWGLLDDKDIAAMKGDEGKLITALQKAYGYDKTRAALETAQWLPQLGKSRG